MSQRADWTDLLGRQKTKRNPRVRDYLRKRGKERSKTGINIIINVQHWLTAIAIVALVLGIVYAVLWSINEGKLLPLKSISMVEAPQKVTTAQLRDSLTEYLHPSILGVDVKGARESLEELPWIRKAQVRRAWPGVLEVKIDERRALGIWNDRALVDYRGQLFRPKGESLPPGLVRLYGPRGSVQQVVKKFKMIGQIFDKQEIKLASLQLSARGSWSAKTVDKVAMAMGSERTVARVERFVSALSALNARRDGQIKRVDLRYPNGFAVAWAAADDSD